jgi:hypothetical protein
MKRILLAFLLLAGVVATARAADTSTDGQTVVYRAAISHKEWPGWKFNPDPKATPREPQHFHIINSDGTSARTFAGKIAGLASMDGVEVGLVSLIGIPWTNEDNYQWEKVAPDGTFSITDARHLDADKAIAVRGPQTAWTFLPFNFNGKHSSRDLVLNAALGRTVTVTASGPDMKDLDHVWIELFDAYSQVDDHGNELNREWLGSYESEDQKTLSAVLPPGEVALFVHHDGYAGFYQIVDPRKADHFHFVLMPGGGLEVETLDRDGKPKSGVSGNWRNSAAPLSYWEVHTNEKGDFLGKNLTPGTFQINVQGFAPCSAEVRPNSLTKVVLREGAKPVISHPTSG